MSSEGWLHALIGWPFVAGLMSYRRVWTASGATVVEIAGYVRGGQRIVEHVGSARTETELGVFLKDACELLKDPAQSVLDRGDQPASCRRGDLQREPASVHE